MLLLQCDCNAAHQEVGSADSRYAKGTVTLTVSAKQTNAAVRGFYFVTETDGIGSIALERRICYPHSKGEAC